MSDSFVYVLLLFVNVELLRDKVCEGDGVGGGEEMGGGEFSPFRIRVSKGWAGTISKQSDLSSPL